LPEIARTDRIDCSENTFTQPKVFAKMQFLKTRVLAIAAIEPGNFTTNRLRPSQPILI
jgi:hypothetical protein